MAAIDKIYLSNFEVFTEFKNWCETQPPIKDKYGKECRISSFLFYNWYDPKYWGDGEHPVMSAPFYIDAYIIRNCPIEEVQKELKINYGFKTQEFLKEAYETVKNRKPEIQKLIDEADGTYPNFPKDVSISDISYWYWSLDDFIIDENGFITIKNDEKSDYELIKEGKLYDKPYIDKYERGKHFRMIKMPSFYRGHVCQRPMCGCWMIEIELPDYVEEKYMCWNEQSHAKYPIGTWDFVDEFVISVTCWSSSATHCKTINALKRRIPKWNLPVGTIVRAIGRYVGEEYEFVVKK